MTRASEQSRRDRILDAAEEAFAEFGFAAAPLRHIVRKAKVNLATVYYYFGSKKGLTEAVFKRRFGPLRSQQLELLRQSECEAGGRPLPVEKIIEVMLLPPLQFATSATQKRKAVLRLIGRIVAEPNPLTQQLLHRQRAEVRGAFLRAFQASLPQVPACDLQWRMEFVWGALGFVMCNPHRIEKATKGACNPGDTKKLIAEMLVFFAPGFHAPACQSPPHDFEPPIE